MIRRLSIAAVLAVLAAPVAAQEPPPAPAATARCGGVLCDLYYSGKPAPAPGQPDLPDPTHLPCRDFLCAAFGGRTPEPTPVAAAPVEPPVAPPPVKHKRKAHRTAAADTPAAEPAR